MKKIYHILFFLCISISIFGQTPKKDYQSKIVNPELNANNFADWITLQPFTMLENTGPALYDYAMQQKEMKFKINKSYEENIKKSLEAAPKRQEESTRVMNEYENTFKKMGEYREKVGRELTREESEAFEKDIENQTKVLSERMTLELMEGPLAGIIGSANTYGEESKKNWQNVQANLGDNEVAIEFLHSRYHLGRWKKNDLYIAIIIRKDYDEPKVIRIGEDYEVEALVVREENVNPNNMYTRGGTPLGKKTSSGKELYDLVWYELDKHLKGIQKIYYAPSGVLHQLSFAALQDEKKNYLGNKYELHQLSTTRSIFKKIPKIYPPKDGCWMIIGDISFDAFPAIPSSSKQIGSDCNISLMQEKNQSNLPKLKKLNQLPGTKVEMDAISSILNKKGIKHSKYSKSEVPEELLKGLGYKYPAPKILHIGTHGFYTEDLEASASVENNPLTRSGLYLSGAEKKLQSNQPFLNREDGIWTAAEIKGQNLKETHLVVLSACNSGLGELQLREGVFGLQRAFKYAGVDKILVSLWEIDDNGTAEFMKIFYQEWLTGITAYDALRRAQQKMQKHAQFNSPYYWAGFVLLE